MWKPHHDTAHDQSHRKTQLYSDWINQEQYSTSKPARTGNDDLFYLAFTQIKTWRDFEN